MVHERVVERSDGRHTYEARRKEGTKFQQRLFLVMRDAERFLASIEVELAASNDIRLFARKRLTVRDAV